MFTIGSSNLIQSAGVGSTDHCSNRMKEPVKILYTRISDNQVQIVRMVGGQIIESKIVTVAEASEILGKALKPPKKEDFTNLEMTPEKEMAKQVEVQAMNDRYNQQLALNNMVVLGLVEGLKAPKKVDKI